MRHMLMVTSIAKPVLAKAAKGKKLNAEQVDYNNLQRENYKALVANESKPLTIESATVAFVSDDMKARGAAKRWGAIMNASLSDAMKALGMHWRQFTSDNCTGNLAWALEAVKTARKELDKAALLKGHPNKAQLWKRGCDAAEELHTGEKAGKRENGVGRPKKQDSAKVIEKLSDVYKVIVNAADGSDVTEEMQTLNIALGKFLAKAGIDLAKLVK